MEAVSLDQIQPLAVQALIGVLVLAIIWMNNQRTRTALTTEQHRAATEQQKTISDMLSEAAEREQRYRDIADKERAKRIAIEDNQLTLQRQFDAATEEQRKKDAATEAQLTALRDEQQRKDADNAAKFEAMAKEIAEFKEASAVTVRERDEAVQQRDAERVAKESLINKVNVLEQRVEHLEKENERLKAEITQLQQRERQPEASQEKEETHVQPQ